MSIILEGIDMPKECKGIELVFIPKDGDIIYNSESMSIGADRIVEIPTPHGRLIDGDELKEKYSNWLEAVPFVNNSLADMGRRDVLISVNHDLTYSAPTILEAEEE